MKLKKTAFAIGLVGTILSAILGFYAYFSLALIFALIKANTLTTLSIYLLPASVVVGLIGTFITFKAPKISGTLMIVAFVLNLIPYALILVIAKSNALSIIKVFITTIIPSILMLASGILSLINKRK